MGEGLTTKVERKIGNENEPKEVAAIVRYNYKKS